MAGSRKTKLLHEFDPGLTGTPRFNGEVKGKYSAANYRADLLSASKMHPHVKDKYVKAVMEKWNAHQKLTNPGRILTPGKWIKARAIRVHRGKLEILK